MSKQQTQKFKTPFFPLKGFIAVNFLKFLYLLPQKVTLFITSMVAKLSYTGSKKNIILTNLKFAYPELTQQQIELLAEQSVAQSGHQLPEFLTAWFGSKKQIENQIANVKNKDILDQLRQEDRSIIVATPHIGNWELLGQWLQINYPMTALYSASKIPQIDQVILQARSKFGGNHCAADKRGVLNLLRRLKTGDLTLVLPDQVPKLGSGIYVPFFGKPAYTMTLIHKLVQKTNAQLVFGYCIRQQNGKDFEINLELPNFGDSEKDVEIFNRSMNEQIEKIIKEYPEQYVWDYKRYKRQSDGSDLYSKIVN